MSTVHLFDNSHQESKGNNLGDLEKTVIINSLMQTPLHERNSNWVEEFVNNIAQANLTLAEPEVLMGLMVSLILISGRLLQEKASKLLSSKLNWRIYCVRDLALL